MTASIAGSIAAISTPPIALPWITAHQKSTMAATAGTNIAPAISAHIAHEWLRWRIHTVMPTVMLSAISSPQTSGAESFTSGMLVPAAAKIAASSPARAIIPTIIARNISPKWRKKWRAPATLAPP